MSGYQLTNGSHWSTAMELDYIDNLMSGRWMSPSVQVADKEKLLKNHIFWAKHRIKHKTFDTIDGLKVIEYCKILLAGKK